MSNVWKESSQPFNVGKADHASYTPNAAINPMGYAKDGGKPAALGNVPSVEANGSVVAALPAMPGTLKIGEDKNVSAIV